METIVRNTRVVRQVLGMLPRLAERRQSDAFAKKLYAWNTALLYLEGILQKRNSTKAIAQHLKSTPWMQKWTGISSIHDSALNRRLNQLPTDYCRQMYETGLEQERRLFKRLRPMNHLGPLSALDSSSLTLGKKRGEWAYTQRGRNAVKMHTCLDLTEEHSGVPHRVVLSTACVADLDAEVTEHLMVNKEATYLMDRGYIDYGQYLKWNREGIRFVARLKANSRVNVIRQQPVTSSSIEKDEEVELTDPDTGETGTFRLVTYTFVDKKGKKHRVRALTNRWDVSAAEVAQMYRYRWKIEIFFKFMKQGLQLKKIYSAKEKAVWNQIYLNLLAYLLVEIWRKTYAATMERGEAMTMLRVYLEQPVEALLAELQRKKERTSRGRRKKGGRPRIHPKKLNPQRILYK